MIWTAEDEKQKNRLASIADKDMLQFMKKTSDELKKLMTYYRCAMMEIETKFKVLDEEYSLIHDHKPISSIKTRLKEMPSIQEKLKRQGTAISMSALENELHDIAGVRVITVR